MNQSDINNSENKMIVIILDSDGDLLSVEFRAESKDDYRIIESVNSRKLTDNRKLEDEFYPEEYYLERDYKIESTVKLGEFYEFDGRIFFEGELESMAELHNRMLELSLTELNDTIFTAFLELKYVYREG